MTDELEKKLRKILNHPSRSESENEELKARIQQLEAENAKTKEKMRETKPDRVSAEAPSSEIEHIIDKINKKGSAEYLPFSKGTLRLLDDLVARYESGKEISYAEQKILTEAAAKGAGEYSAKKTKKEGYDDRSQDAERKLSASVVRHGSTSPKIIKEYALPVLKELIVESRKQMLDASSGESLTLAVLSMPPKRKSKDKNYAKISEAHKQYYACQDALEKAKAMRREGDTKKAHGMLIEFLKPIARRNAEYYLRNDRDLREEAIPELVDRLTETHISAYAVSETGCEIGIGNEMKKAKETFEKLLPDDKAKREYATKLL